MKTPSSTRRPLFVAPPIYLADGTLRIQRVLVANRGEIACRIINSCQKVGIQAVAVYADVDEKSLYVKKANEAVCIGLAEEKPYQNIELLIKVAKELNVQAIHPGYGYLSENPDFAEAILAAGLIFIGPTANSIKALGDKRIAKIYLAANSQVPLIPGYNGLNQDIALLEDEADKIGFPLLVKASAGGGGKGMRIVNSRDAFREAFIRCSSEAERSFGSSHCLLEKYIEEGKHVEIQIFGDGETWLSFLDRECSVQRRYQKIIEESPCAWMSAEMRRKMSDTAVEIARLLKYESAGTVEFIVDVKEKRFYFLEVNTRIQVEHPITEEVTGVDLVALQLFAAAGGKLSSLPELGNITQQGHAIEVRLCAENPMNDFLPCTGTVQLFSTASETLGTEAPDVRYELGVETGSQISVFFDSMISKIIVWSHDRVSAIQKMRTVLQYTVCLGLNTNQVFLQRALSLRAFQRLDYTTSFIQLNSETLLAPLDYDSIAGPLAVAATIFDQSERSVVTTSNIAAFRSIPAGFRNQRQDRTRHRVSHLESDLILKGDPDPAKFLVANESEGHYKVWQVPNEAKPTAKEKKVFFNKYGGALTQRYYAALKGPQTARLFNKTRTLECSSKKEGVWTTGKLRIVIGGKILRFLLSSAPQEHTKVIYVHCLEYGFATSYCVSDKLVWAGKLAERSANAGSADGAGKNKYVSPMPCTILQMLVKDGAVVKSGDGLLVMESMKTELRMVAAAEGVVKTYAKEGDRLAEGVLLCEIIGAEEEE